MWHIKIYPDTYAAHISQIIAGLFELEAKGKVKVDYSNNFSAEFRRTKSYTTLWIQVRKKSQKRVKNICFDMFDGGQIYAIDRLRLCDIYFKRSYSEKYLSTLSKELREKIVPYGLNYCCRSNNEKYELKRLFCYYKINKELHSKRSTAIKIFFSQLSKVVKTKLNLSRLMSYTDFESEPTSPVEEKIIFLTRVFDDTHSKAKNTSLLNYSRVETLRALRNHFGEKVIGGLAPNDFAKKNYPDYLAEISTNKKHYINTMKKALIAIATAGLHLSIGFKFAEYLASSKCIVTEPLEYELPVPLKEEENFFSYRTPEECIRLCEVLLTNQKIAQNMRFNNHKYYLDEVTPSSLIHSCLKRADAL